jgi:twitching motility protein PilT
MQLEGIRALLERIVQRWPRASDVLFVAGASIQVEVDGVLQPVRLRHGRPLSPALTQDMAHCLLRDRPDLRAALEKRGSCDFSWNIPWGIRLRVNVFRQRGRLALVMRRLPEHIPDMAELRLPVVFEDMAREPQGLALITGGTGTGKTHSLAALIQRINHTRAVHVVTLEDPVEFLHEPVEAVVSQRELHTDFDHFATGLRAALRQAPKVIVVGEVRDRESMEVVLQAATTGHLVLATLHTADVGTTIQRVLGLFEPQEERLVRMRLAACLRYVVCQQLLPRGDRQGRVPVFEVLRNGLRVRELIEQGESGDKTFHGVLETSQAQGMQTFDQDLLRLFEQGEILEHTALLAATDRARLRIRLDELKARQGRPGDELPLRGLEEDWDADLR